MHNNVFSQTSQNIKKAQKHQAKCYNARNSGTPFKVGEKVLKRNMRDASHQAKMQIKYTGPYQITSISSNSQYYLKDKYSHQLKRPVPANKLVPYYGVGGFCRPRQNVEVENCENSPDEIGGASTNADSMLNDSDDVSDSQTVYCMILVPQNWILIVSKITWIYVILRAYKNLIQIPIYLTITVRDPESTVKIVNMLKTKKKILYHLK